MSSAHIDDGRVGIGMPPRRGAGDAIVACSRCGVFRPKRGMRLVRTDNGVQPACRVCPEPEA